MMSQKRRLQKIRVFRFLCCGSL